MHESGEMYLETIYILSQKSPAVRSIDVAAEMGFSKPSVSRGMGLLKKGDFITVDDKGYIELTETGLEYAKKIYERHTVLTELLVSFGIDEETAADFSHLFYFAENALKSNILLLKITNIISEFAAQNNLARQNCLQGVARFMHITTPCK